jgi:hypothetical protein
VKAEKNYNVDNDPKQKSINPSFHSYKLVEASREIDYFLKCNLVLFLNDHFDSAMVEDLINRYKLGATEEGDIIFWQLDIDYNIRAGKIMAYSRDGHRKDYPTWVHSKLGLNDFNLKQCFFGEHLLSDEPDKKVCIVESEKTALICHAFFPDMLWLAAGGIHGINKPDKLKVLQGRDVLLWPDIGAYEKWESIAAKNGFGISGYLEESANEQEQGKDIADFLIEEDLELF